jgi:hypothetical protein
MSRERKNYTPEEKVAVSSGIWFRRSRCPICVTSWA